MGKEVDSMKFVVKSFLEHIDEVNDTNYMYGNEILYKMCDITKIIPCNSSDKDKIKNFGSAIWLIGRSYAASPERRQGAKNNGEGLGDFFTDLAENIVADKQYPEFLDIIDYLKGEDYSYKYDFNSSTISDLKHDLDLLFKSAKCVQVLNEMIKRSVQKIDGTDTARNNISFCSKFLHFLIPNIVFIIDSYSYNGAVSLFKGRKKGIFFEAESIAKIKRLEIDEFAREFFSDWYSKIYNGIQIDNEAKKYSIYTINGKMSSLTDNVISIRNYVFHITRAYCLAHYLKENDKTTAMQIEGDLTSCYMPRLVDSVLMRIK